VARPDLKSRNRRVRQTAKRLDARRVALSALWSAISRRGLDFERPLRLSYWLNYISGLWRPPFSSTIDDKRLVFSDLSLATG
jgi:hypothetical protein